MTFNFQKSYQGLNRGYNSLELVDYLEKTYTFKTIKDTKEIYYYNKKDGIFVKNGEALIEQETEAINPGISTTDVNEIINHIKRRTYIDREEFDSKIEWHACKNSMINLITGETQPYSPEFMATIQIPIIYRKNIQCPKIMKFLYEIVSDRRDVNTILDFLAYCLWREMKFHKFLILNGEGRNGKSTLCKLIRIFLGINNVASESLDQLLKNRFSPSQLFRKMVNIDADTSKKISEKMGILKKLTGDDMISAEEKYKPQFNFINHSKLILVSNELPEIKEDTIAIFSRLLIVDFSKTFIENANPDLIKELTTEEELSGLLNVLLKRLPRVLKYGISYTKSVKEISENYQLRLNSVKYFAENYLEKVFEGKITKEVVYNNYREFCYKNKIPPKSEYKFSQEMRALGFEYKQLRDGSQYRPYYWINLRIKNESN